MTYAEDHDLYYHIRKLGSFEDEVIRMFLLEFFDFSSHIKFLNFYMILNSFFNFLIIYF